jgi:hypothetical protein
MRVFSPVLKFIHRLIIISDKNIRHFTCDFELLLGKTQLDENLPKYLRKTALSTAKVFYCTGRECSICRPCARPHIYFFVFYLYKQSPSDNLLSLKWNRLRIFHHHDKIVARARSSIYNRTLYLGFIHQSANTEQF